MEKRDLEKEFEKKYQNYGKMLYKIAFLYVGNSSDAEDVLHDVFMKYLETKKNFKDENHEKAWFIRVTQNKCLDRLKKSERKNVSLSSVEETAYEESENLKDVLKKVLELPEKYKSSVILYYYNDMSIKEISLILKISVSAVKMRLERARKLLKLELEDYAQ